MNIQQLRQSLKQNWLSYYEQNISWLVKMRIWGTYNGLRRPLSGFILATLSVLEPQFDEILAFMLDLNNDPDKIVAALGLNFNPDEELRLIKLDHSMAITQVESESLDENHSEDQYLSSAVTAIDSNLSHADELVPSITATTEVVHTRKPELIVANATKIAPDTPAKTPSSGLLREHQQVRWHSGELPSRGSATMTSEVNSKAKTIPSVALATKVKSNAPSARIPVGASLAISTEISSNGKPVRSPLGRIASRASLGISTEVKSNGKQPNIQPENVKSKVNSPTTNARSIASWVDEFCYGARNKEEDILT